MKRRLDADGECGGYYYEMKEGAREIRELNAAYDRVKAYMTITEFTSLCNLPIGKFETVVADRIKTEAELKGEKMTKKAANAKVLELTNGLVVRGTPKKCIVRA